MHDKGHVIPHTEEIMVVVADFVGLARSFPCLFFASFYVYTHMLASSSLLLTLVYIYYNY